MTTFIIISDFLKYTIYNNYHNISIGGENDIEFFENQNQTVGVMSLEVVDDKLISGGDDSVIRVWNTNSWSCERIIRYLVLLSG